MRRTLQMIIEGCNFDQAGSPHRLDQAMLLEHQSASSSAFRF
jgi:hypothetical protein